MSEPQTRQLPCPNCSTTAFALVPGDAVLVDETEDADGMVRSTCSSCGERFLVHYRNADDD